MPKKTKGTPTGLELEFEICSSADSQEDFDKMCEETMLDHTIETTIQEALSRIGAKGRWKAEIAIYQPKQGKSRNGAGAG